MRSRARLSGATAAVAAACLASVAIGVAFIFIRAPHPWGWEGLDHYHDLGLLLAGGGTFPTTDVPWGYAYFLAVFYRLAGDRPWLPLLAQALLNGLIPWLVYIFARTEFDERVAVVAALLTGVLSFNTVYASTQSSDSVCTVLFMAALVAFVRGRRRRDGRWLATAGLLMGAASQFRPNLLFVPLLLAGAHLAIPPRAPGRLRQAAVLLAMSGLVMTPWVVRNYRLTREIIPTSTHGGIQLWYGTLQSGRYLQSRSYNPRAIFETSTFQYTSVEREPLVVSAAIRACAPGRPQSVVLVHWTDREPAHARLTPRPDGPDGVVAELPPSPAPTVAYFYFETAWPDAPALVTTPAAGAGAPFVFFVSTDHLGDLDRHGDLLDVFDLARMLRAVAWHEALPFAGRLDLDRDGRVTEHDIRIAAGLLLSDSEGDQVDAVALEAGTAAILFRDGSRIAVPRSWSGRVTDLSVDGALAEKVLQTTRSFAEIAEIAEIAAPGRAATDAVCRELEEVAVNRPFYRREPHAMRRYTALALDNIRRDPRAYLAGVAYRAFRLFVIQGSDDRGTVQQFADSALVYRAATAVSLGYFVLLLAGVWTAWRRGFAIALPVALIAYVPLTIAYVLTNMRYSITVQPLVFMFVATAGVTAWDRVRGAGRAADRRSAGTGDPSGNRTAPRP